MAKVEVPHKKMEDLMGQVLSEWGDPSYFEQVARALIEQVDELQGELNEAEDLAAEANILTEMEQALLPFLKAARKFTASVWSVYDR